MRETEKKKAVRAKEAGGNEPAGGFPVRFGGDFPGDRREIRR